MSRIGKKPVDVPSGVTITVGKDNIITVKGPKGELKQDIDRDIVVEIKDNTVLFSRPTDQIRHRAMHGLYRSLISNMVKGVTEGFKKELELVGVGYKAANQGNILDFEVSDTYFWSEPNIVNEPGMRVLPNGNVLRLVK
jgi:large subunit ribosomal protein L6